jgi:hypothetical protein
MQYRDLIPRPRTVGLLTGIRSSLRSMHDPNDPNVSDECRAHLKRGMMAGMVAVMAMLLTGVLIVTVRAFGLQHIF